uniref:3-oxoacyl-[acyl-carrier-protein] reductase n=2 Tax=Nephromyces sp. MMRI TaxID=2496275 RepID=A0A3Q8UBZ8_9APIC|nr:dehydrogenase/reductase 4 [Nephromyces sp. MMRI]AZL94619.1 dehydrogenase/reductase 4 [Nephromyces sp. MMRI]
MRDYKLYSINLSILFITIICLNNIIKLTTSFKSSPNQLSSLSWNPSLEVPENRLSASGNGHFPLTFGQDRIALVTGASRGIGKKVAETLAQSGVSKILCISKSQKSCEEVADSLKSYGCDAYAYGVDVSDGPSVKKLCDQLIEEHGPIEILVNNAGITKDNLMLRMSHEQWDDVINTNLNSAFYFTSGLLRAMTKKKFGRIINMASVVGITGNVGQANYAAAKAGLIGFTKTLSKEVASRGITVNAVAPGFIRSAMTDKMTDAAKAAALRNIPAGTLGTPDDVSNLVAFLASDQSSYINGKVIPVDGAMT